MQVLRSIGEACHQMKYPRRLYKYKSFSSLSLSLLIEDQIFLADPASFNDPLDTKPALKVDIEHSSLLAILDLLLRKRYLAEAAAASRTIGHNLGNVESNSRERARKSVFRKVGQEIFLHRGGPMDDEMLSVVVSVIEDELLRAYGWGILSLAERSNCPLMWSHYGDQHRGICLGYSVPENSGLNLKKVKYGGPRQVNASDVLAMLKDVPRATEAVDTNVLLRKAHSWRYEREWRLIGQRGLTDSSLELEEVVFGLRCPNSVKHAVGCGLEGRGREVKLFEIREQPGTFKLRKYVVNMDELKSGYPRHVLGALEGFDDLTAQK